MKRLSLALSLAILCLSGAAHPALRPSASGTAPEFGLTPADLPPPSAGPVSFELPAAGTRALAAPLAGLFAHGFRDTSGRARHCRDLPPIRPPDYYAVGGRRFALPYFGGLRLPYPEPAAGANPQFFRGFGDESMNIYLLCLQQPAR